MRSLKDIIKELKQDLPNKDKGELSSLADEAIKEAIEITRNEKAMHSGFLEPLTNDLAELINLFPNDILFDDLRYHLAHLYMGSQKWKEAETQLVEIKDYLHNEAQIYSALCAFKQGDKLDSIQADIERITKELSNSKSVRTKSIQEQHYNLLEMLVYASGLNHSVLEPYYMTGLIRSDLTFRYRVRYFEQNLTKVDLNFGLPKPLSLARFRLLNLLQYGKKQEFFIIDLTNGRF
jgi:CRISPR/Cas system-associated protein endoribonuclease Cas2